MKLQLAIDRLPLGQAIVLASRLWEDVDIIEVGTSLIKDYGVLSVREFRAAMPDDVLLLADMKIMDEAAYEAKAAFENGADFVTVMGAASTESIRAVEQVATEYQKDYVIDMMGVDNERSAELFAEFKGVFCLHIPSDVHGDIAAFAAQSPIARYSGLRWAIAGGITLESVAPIQEAGFAIAVVGGAITKQPDVQKAAKAFKEVMT